MTDHEFESKILEEEKEKLKCTKQELQQRNDKLKKEKDIKMAELDQIKAQRNDLSTKCVDLENEVDVQKKLVLELQTKLYQSDEKLQTLKKELANTMCHTDDCQNETNALFRGLNKKNNNKLTVI